MTTLASGSHRQAAFAMSLGAGMATGLGAAFVLCTRSLDRKLLACTLAFSAGVMIYVSLVEVVLVSNEYFAKDYRPPVAYAQATASFFSGSVIMAVVDRIVHFAFDSIARSHPGSYGGGHDHHKGVQLAPTEEETRLGGSISDEEAMGGLGNDPYGTHAPYEDESAPSIRAIAQTREKSRLLMMAAVVSAAIVLHNIPEGMATYVASFHSVSAGAPLAIAIAIHNIPEGLAVAMPIYYATGSRVRAITLGTLSGMSEPFGALLASLVANEQSSSAAFGGMFGLTGGMMAYVCIAELLPAAFEERGVPREAVIMSFFVGCFVMASSLVVEKFATA
mmetsp:Transcript_62472/g.123449  ORF Transcript_62472/g.123449 Transcript_62472/m.123449 type:complete len:334 (-) Transcript_62472:78-1079(-)